MNTPSHLLMTAALRKGLQHRAIVPSAFLLGSVAPDMALYLLSLGGTIYYRLFLGWSSQATFRYMFDDLYFQHPFWIAAHNLLHSPILLLLVLLYVWGLRHYRRAACQWLLWFVLACLLHSGVDIVTHVDDGPLLLFPFEWTRRFQSPVSYWDSAHYGREFTLFELTLDLLLLGYLYASRVWSWLTGVTWHLSNVLDDAGSSWREDQGVGVGEVSGPPISCKKSGDKVQTTQALYHQPLQPPEGNP